MVTALVLSGGGSLGAVQVGMLQALAISETTVSSHISHILAKLGGSSRTAAASFAHEHGLL